ncbi:hypothetical protein KR032_007979, partial [Drosophila birchii]
TVRENFPGMDFHFVPRQKWLAQPSQKKIPTLNLPVDLVVVMHTNSDSCNTKSECILRVQLRQTFDIETMLKDDIAFNFLIGGDGNIYEGRGWDQEGAHLANYDSRSLSLAFIGHFQNQQPTPKQLSATRLLLENGVALGKIAPNYRMTAASSLDPTRTAYKADALFQSLSSLTHWSDKL